MKQAGMEDAGVAKAVSRTSALIYAPVSIGAALLFALAASLTTGERSLAGKIGGAVWVGLLSLIVSMPLVISRVKKRFNRGR